MQRRILPSLFLKGGNEEKMREKKKNHNNTFLCKDVSPRLLTTTHIWNCGRCWAGRASIKSNSLHAARYKVNQAGWLWAFSPFCELKTQDESRVERRFKCELEEIMLILTHSLAIQESYPNAILLSETEIKEKKDKKMKFKTINLIIRISHPLIFNIQRKLLIFFIS